MNVWISAVLMLFGGVFMLLAAVGVLRMPDLPTRMHATTKAGSLGAGLVLLSVAVYFGELSVTTRAIATLLFIVLTAPVAAHIICRAAYFTGVPLWKGMVRDELRGQYDAETGRLESGTPKAGGERSQS
jgi:multicomponent Na+:H+ antiporter subunit G